jgi:hypothetical protein
MGLKGYRLWDMGQLDSTCRAPPHVGPRKLAQVDGVMHGDVTRTRHLQREHLRRHLVVAMQVAFERRTLKPAFSLDMV